MKFYSHFVSQVSPSAAQVGSVYLERQMSNSNVHTSLMSLEVFSLPPLSDIFKVAHGNVQESDYIFGCPSSVSMLVLTHNATVLPSAKFWSCDRYTVPQTNFTARCIAHLHSL